MDGNGSTNKLSEFFRESAGKGYNLVDVDSVIDSRGDLKELRDIDVIINSIVKLLSIVKGTYIFDPDMGCGLHRFLFEPADLNTLQKIREEINRNIYSYERRAKISTDVRFMANKKGFIINIVVEMGKDRRESSIMFDESVLNSIR